MKYLFILLALISSQAFAQFADFDVKCTYHRSDMDANETATVTVYTGENFCKPGRFQVYAVFEGHDRYLVTGKKRVTSEGSSYTFSNPLFEEKFSFTVKNYFFGNGYDDYENWLTKGLWTYTNTRKKERVEMNCTVNDAVMDCEE